jgi:transcriptional regulator with XRE-family HTH domain
MHTAPAPDDAAPDGPAGDDPARDGAAARVRIALNRHRQRELYGSPLGDRVRRLTAALGITQARLARTLGVSPAMLSQLASARRVKIGDPAVLARLQLLDQRCGAAAPHGRVAVEALLDEVGRARLQWTARDGDAVRSAPRGVPVPTGAALRAVAPPARLAAAAATLAPAFPELAEVLRQAARGAGAGTAPAAGSGPRRAPRRPW